ncbi:hypothetical protein CASFOL_026764 [Castilleja foliolosa]|uniref:Uncharacterized protein n=1 Tax=Castilleja foliolosa TaxID=1961234 RepID=A0ABD3CJ90_9LAMI
MGKKKATEISDPKLSDTASGSKPPARQRDGGPSIMVKVSDSQLNQVDITAACSSEGGPSVMPDVFDSVEDMDGQKMDVAIPVVQPNEELQLVHVEVQDDGETKSEEEDEESGGYEFPVLDFAISYLRLCYFMFQTLLFYVSGFAI